MPKNTIFANIRFSHFAETFCLNRKKMLCVDACARELGNIVSTKITPLQSQTRQVKQRRLYYRYTVRNFYRNFMNHVTEVSFSQSFVKLRQNFRKFSNCLVNLRNNFLIFSYKALNILTLVSRNSETCNRNNFTLCATKVLYVTVGTRFYRDDAESNRSRLSGRGRGSHLMGLV